MQPSVAKPRARGIDGLRALCIASIIIYHLNLPWLPSGHMGVVVFLVLSGYFATYGIARICDTKGSAGFVDLLRSWGKRLLRIVPSVFALVAIVGVLCATLNHVLFTKMRPDVLPSVGFFLNWSYIIRDVSYFDLIGGTSPLLHLWYMGVDLQFFLAWTLVLVILLKIGKRFARRVAFLLAIASAAWMFWLYVPGADPSRVYYGTDTRAFALLLGSWLALAFPLGSGPQGLARMFVKSDKKAIEKGAPEDTVRATVWSHLLGLLSFAGLVAAMVLIPADSYLWYRGGMFAFAVVTTLLAATLLAPRSLMGLLLGLAPLRVLGTRSFALYLWHYPIILLMAANKSTTEWWMRLAAVGAAFVAAEISLQLFERPFQLSKAAGSQSEGEHPGRNRKILLGTVATLAIGCAGVYTYTALTTIPDETLVPEHAIVSTGAAANSAMDLSSSSIRPQSSSSSSTQKQQEAQSSSSSSVAETQKPVEVTQETIVHADPKEVSSGKRDPVLIGDSVPGDAGNEFVANQKGWEGRLPDGLFDSYIGRSPNQALEVLKGYLGQGVVGKVVVLACFSNSTPFPETLDAFIEAVGPDRVLYLVGTVNPDGFQDAANENLKAAANAHDNVHYVDWPAELEGHMSEYLWADDTHLRPEGARVYVDMVVRNIAQSMVDAGGSTSEE